MRGRYADALLSDGGAAPAARGRPAVNEFFQPEWNGGTTLLGPDRSALVRRAGTFRACLACPCRGTHPQGLWSPRLTVRARD